MRTLNLCFEQKYEKKYQSFSSENFQFFEVKFSIYLNRRVFVMIIYLKHDNLLNACKVVFLKHCRTFIRRKAKQILTCVAFPDHYQNTPIQICRKFYLQK